MRCSMPSTSFSLSPFPSIPNYDRSSQDILIFHARLHGVSQGRSHILDSNFLRGFWSALIQSNKSIVLMMASTNTMTAQITRCCDPLRKHPGHVKKQSLRRPSASALQKIPSLSANDYLCGVFRSSIQSMRVDNEIDDMSTGK